MHTNFLAFSIIFAENMGAGGGGGGRAEPPWTPLHPPPAKKIQQKVETKIIVFSTVENKMREMHN